MNTTLRSVLAAGTLVASSLIAQAQRAVPATVFALRPSQTSAQAVQYGDTKAAVLRVLGSPTKTTRFYYEIEKVWATILHYGPNELHFVAGHLESMVLHDGRWVVGQPGTPGFRVGSVLSKAARQTGPGTPLAFGVFAVENKAGTDRNFSYSAISAGNFKTPQGGVSDDGYAVLYDAQGKVTHVFAN
jgi:hypothetical protein